MVVFWKIIKAVLVFLVIIIILNSVLDNSFQIKRVQFGVTFVPRYAKYLGLDWQKNYLQILDDLQARNLRLVSYWDTLEPKINQYNFTETDYLLAEAAKRGAKVILVVGARQPRWPECHVPSWAGYLKAEDRQKKLLEYIQTTVEKYRNQPAVWAWQVENEPLFSYFGQGCDKPDQNFLKAEVELVKKLDSRPVILTDSGEFGVWLPLMQLSDIFGISVYRKAYDPLLGYKSYPIPAYFYQIRSILTRNIFAPNNQKTIITELQAEPWVQEAMIDTPLDKQLELFSIQDFKDNIEYAKKTGFETNYLWGAEWWYYMAQNGHPEYLEYAKTLFK